MSENFTLTDMGDGLLELVITLDNITFVSRLDHWNLKELHSEIMKFKEWL